MLRLTPFYQTGLNTLVKGHQPAAVRDCQREQVNVSHLLEHCSTGQALFCRATRSVARESVYLWQRGPLPYNWKPRGLLG